jgi:hypothetical protein
VSALAFVLVMMVSWRILARSASGFTTREPSHCAEELLSIAMVWRADLVTGCFDRAVF